MKLFSQRDPLWASQKLGYGQTTIHDYGCTITALAQLLALNGHNETPATINAKLKQHKGFVGANKNLLVWSAVARAFPFAKHLSRATYNNNAVLEAIEKYGGCMVEVNGSRIGASKHWVLYIGGGEMIDPWTGTKRPTNYYPAIGYSSIAVEEKNMSQTYTQEQWQTERDERNKNWDLYQSQLRENERLETQIVSLKKEIKDLHEEISELVKQPATGIARIDREVPVAGIVWKINGIQIDSEGKVTANYAKK